MTNCRNASILESLRAALPTLVMYEPLREPSAAQFAAEGARLLVEQAIAARAVTFIGSEESAVSQYVMQLRRAAGRPTDGWDALKKTRWRRARRSEPD